MGFLGIDVGGTFIKVVKKDNTSFIQDKIRIEDYHKSHQSFTDTLIDIIQKYKPLKVGIAVAGLVDKSGRITSSPNLKYIENLNLKAIVESTSGIPTLVGNDANLATYGEYVYGNGKGSKLLICLTLGTGLGGGVVVEGKILEGVSGCGMEVGHMIVEKDGELCNCGRRGCLEAYVSSYGLERIYTKLSNNSLSSFDIIKSAKRGEKRAIESFEVLVDYFSLGVMNLVHIFNPDRILLSGGIVENYSDLVEKVKLKVKSMAFPLPASILEIGVGALGSWSGAYGALAFAENYSS